MSYQPGDRVEILRGPYKGQVAVVVGDTLIRNIMVQRAGGTSTFHDPTSLKPAASQRVPLRGAAMHLWQSPDWRRELGLIADAGANCVRFDVNWRQPDKHWNNGKAVLVADAMAECRRLGLKPIVSFLTEGAGPADDVTRSEYAAAAKWFAGVWKADLGALEVWNEPNEPGAGYMTPASYAALVKATYPAVKTAAPSVPVLVGSLSRCDIPYLRSFIGQAPLSFDGLAIHPYSRKWPYSTVGTALDVDGLQAVYVELPNTPLWCTEFGASTVSKTVDPNYSVTEQRQDYLIGQAWYDVDALPFVQAATLYNTVENGPDTIWGKWGVVRRDWTLKPGYAALKAGITR